MFKIWFEREVLPSYEKFLSDSITVLGPASATADTPFKAVSLARGILASSFEYSQEIISQAPELLVISRTGIGYEKVDVEAATAAGIAICNAPDGPTISTAECTITLMLTVAKNIKQIENELHRELKNGTKRHFYQDYRGIELSGKQLGLVGLGRIGSHVARIAKAIGMKVSAYDPFIKPEKVSELGIELLDSLEALLQSSDVVSLHLPLTEENQKFMNSERFAQMKQGAIFINAARGGHVDEQALVEVLNSGYLFGAGLDVSNPEPMQIDNPLIMKENVVITPHIASGTFEGKFRIYDMAVKQILMVLRGEHPPHLVNPEVWEHVLDRRKELINKIFD